VDHRIDDDQISGQRGIVGVRCKSCEHLQNRDERRRYHLFSLEITFAERTQLFLQ
jgi:hypothetical protein